MSERNRRTTLTDQLRQGDVSVVWQLSMKLLSLRSASSAFSGSASGRNTSIQRLESVVIRGRERAAAVAMVGGWIPPEDKLDSL